MYTTEVNPQVNRRMSVRLLFRRFLFLIAALIVAMTFTACPGTDENGDDQNGNGGGVAGKRIKTILQTTGPMDAWHRLEWSYNSDGTIKRHDWYDESSKLIMYATFISNTDGTTAKEEGYYPDNSRAHLYEYSYDSNKKPKQAKYTYYHNGVSYLTQNVEYTFQNGRKTREVLTSGDQTNDYVYNYDSQGRRTSVTHTFTSSGFKGSRQIVRTYNTDGTLQKVTYPLSFSDNTTITRSFTWEDGKKTVNEDDFLLW